MLLVDIGNSSVKWAETASTNRFDMLQQLYPQNVTKKFFIEIWNNIKKPEKLMVTCVAGKHVWQAMEEACHVLWDMKAERITSTQNGYGLINAYSKPADLGSDRWCAMIGAQQSADSAFIVIAAGSALTLDMVDESGQHLGGYIMPGLNMMRKSLGLDTAQVKTDVIENKSPSLSLARSTTGCVEAGIYLSSVKLIEAVYEKESKNVKTLQCYISGGNANLIANLLGFKCVIMPDIVLRGLAHIAETQNNNLE